MSTPAWEVETAQVTLEVEVREEVITRADGSLWRCWLARHPATGIMTQAETRDGVLRSIRLAVEGMMIVMRTSGQSYEDAQYRVQAFNEFIRTVFRRGDALITALPDPRSFSARWRALNETEPMAHEMGGETMRMYECLCACPIVPGGITHGPDCLLNPANRELT